MIELPVRVQNKISPEPNTGCWLWTGSLVAKKYGNMRWHGKVVRAHRFTYEFYKGSIPAGLTVDHLCNNTFCVNPDHLSLASSGENTLRGNNLAAINARKITCIYGHALVIQRVTHRGRLRRDCVECRQRQNKLGMERYRARHK